MALRDGTINIVKYDAEVDKVHPGGSYWLAITALNTLKWHKIIKRKLFVKIVIAYKQWSPVVQTPSPQLPLYRNTILCHCLEP